MTFRQFFSDNLWWGKILGAFFGYLIAGPAGALIGIFIGNFFDKALAKHFSNPLWSFQTEKNSTVQTMFFEATFAVMGHIAKADGRVSQEEIRMAMRLMGEMGLNFTQRNAAKAYFMQGKEPSYDVDKVIILLKRSCHNNPELLKLFMEIQYKAAQTDGLSQGKIMTLDRIFYLLGFAPLRDQPRFYQDFYWNNPRQEQQSQAYGQGSQGSRTYQSDYQNPYVSTKLAQAYAILEVSSTASKLEVKRSYRKLISRNHPDKLIAKGLPESMIKLANDKTQKITKAYEEICLSKGW